MIGNTMTVPKDSWWELFCQEPDEDTAEIPYDDSQDHTKCDECEGTGVYVGFMTKEHCKECDGSGWV